MTWKADKKRLCSYDEHTVSLKADLGLGSTTSADLLLSGGAPPVLSSDVTSDKSANRKPPFEWLHEACWFPLLPPPLPLPPLLLLLLAVGGCCCC